MNSSNQGNSSGRVNFGPDDDPHQFSFQNYNESPHGQSSSPYFPKNTSTSTANNNPPTYPPQENFNQTFSSDEKKHHSKRKTANSVVIHIKLGAGLTREIICDLDDDVLELAKNFCLENNLSPDAVPVIIKMITQQFSVMLKRIKDHGKASDNSAVDEILQKPYNPQSSKGMVAETIPERQPVPKRAEVAEKAQIKPKLLGKLDVMVGPNEIKELKLYQGQDPYEISERFCHENNFPPQIVEALGNKLNELRQAYEGRKKTKESLHSSNDTINIQSEVEGKTAHFGGYTYPPDEYDQPRSDRVQEAEYKNPFTSDIYVNHPEPPIGSPNFNGRVIQNPIEPDYISEQVPKDYVHYSEIPSRTDTESHHPQMHSHTSLQPQVQPSRTNTESHHPQIHSHASLQPQVQVPQDIHNIQANPTKNPFETEAASSYERWNALIKERNAGKQIGSPMFGSTVKDETRDKSPGNLKSDKIYKQALVTFADKLHNPKALKQVLEEEESSPKKDSGKKITKGQVSALVDRLYYRELEKGPIVEEIRQNKKLKKQKEEDKELTFHPKISRFERSPPDRYKDHIDRVHASEELKSKQIQESFTFRPKISEASIQIAKNRARSRSPIYTQLYTEGIAQKGNNEKWRQAVFKEKHPFSPRLPEDMDKFLKSRPKENQQEFINRLVNEAGEREERKFKARLAETNNNLKDPATGQKYFQPIVTHDKYYQNLKNREEEEYSRERSRTPDYNQGSTYIYSNEGFSYIELELKDIFDKLDGDHDGFISADKIDLSRLDSDILKTLLDFIELLEKSHAKLDFNAFISTINRLKLEDNIRDAVRKTSNAGQNSHFFLEKTIESNVGADKTLNNEHPDYILHGKKTKIVTKKSDSSTASSNQTDNSGGMKLPKRYQGILEKKFLEKTLS